MKLGVTVTPIEGNKNFVKSFLSFREAHECIVSTMEAKTRNLELELEKAGKTNYETTVTLEAKVRGREICIFKIVFTSAWATKAEYREQMTDEPIVTHKR